MTDKLNIGYEMAQFDTKNRAFFDDLSDEEKKKFSPFLMIRWGSLVDGDTDLQTYYLMSTNERLNKHFFDINTTQHKKFQWLLATTVSPGMGKMSHKWLAAKKRESNNNKSEKFLRNTYPELKDDEIKLLADINDKASLRQLARAHGYTDEQIRKELP
jgi:hypothetical protein